MERRNGANEGNLGRIGANDEPPQSTELQGDFGAGDRDRTDDIQLGKLTFYH